MECLLKILDSITNLVVLSIVPLGIAAFINRMMHDSVTVQVRSQETRWGVDRKETAYLECLKLLWDSRCKYHKESKLDHNDFLGRMASLKYVEPWIVVAGNRSSTESRNALEGAFKSLKERIDLVRQEEPKDSGDTYPTDEKKKIFVVEGHGLPEEIDRVFGVVKECCINELQRGC